MHTQTIALIDDDRNILTSISIALEKEGFKVQTYIDGESALIGLTRTPPDLAVIDIKMPKMDGEELLKKLRKKTSLPVIFLTSKDEEIDELLSLKLGADDFIKKSGGFSIKVLIERIRVQLRKKDIKVNLEETKNIISHGKLKLDPSQLECEWDSIQLPDKLTTTEFLIVKELAKRPGIIKERAQLTNIPSVSTAISCFYCRKFRVNFFKFFSNSLNMAVYSSIFNISVFPIGNIHQLGSFFDYSWSLG